MGANRKLTLEQLEGDAWPDPGASTNLATKCHELRKVPVGELSVESLRMLIGQKIGLAHLVPLALEQLERNPWVSGDFYDGDLLESVLKVGPKFWTANSELRERLDRIMIELQGQRDRLEKRILPAWQKLYEK